jgi:hypothetical protein
MDRVTILGTGKSVFKYQREDGEVWVMNKAFLFDQNADKLFLFHTLEEVFPDLGDRLLVKHSGVKIIGNQKSDDFISIEEFPLDEVAKHTEVTYFRCTLAYCLAYASYLGVSRVDLIGCDYEAGAEREDEKSCVEFWIGFLKGQGIEVRIHPDSSLCTGLFYGYENVPKYEEEFNRT